MSNWNPRRDNVHTWYRLAEPELPPILGRPISLFSPTFREPSLIAELDDEKGSGAATLDSFYVYDQSEKIKQPEQHRLHFLAFFADHF